MTQEIEYDENGRIVYQRSLSQNNEYWRNCVGQCVFWYKQSRISCGKSIDLSDVILRDYFHGKFKENVLHLFNVESTRFLNDKQWMEYVAECFIYISKSIDCFEFGEV